MTYSPCGMHSKFLSTPSVRRATAGPGLLPPGPFYFYPRPPCGGRLELAFRQILGDNFYPRPPCGGRHGAAAVWAGFGRFLSTPSVRRATGTLVILGSLALFLSTPSVRRATAKVHKILFAFAAQTRKFVVLILQKYTLSASIKTISCSFTSFLNYLLVRRSQCFSVRFMFAPSTTAARHPATTAGSARYAPPSSCKSFPNSKSAGYRIPDQSTASILLSKPHIEPHPAGIQTLNFVRAARDQHKLLQLCASVCVQPVFLCLHHM